MANTLKVGKRHIKHSKVVSQVSWVDKHPTAGVVLTLGWGELAAYVEQQKKANVLSLKVAEDGIEVYLADLPDFERR